MIKKKKDNVPAINQAKDLIHHATESSFYGKLTFQFQKGIIVLIRGSALPGRPWLGLIWPGKARLPTLKRRRYVVAYPMSGDYYPDKCEECGLPLKEWDECPHCGALVCMCCHECEEGKEDEKT